MFKHPSIDYSRVADEQTSTAPGITISSPEPRMKIFDSQSFISPSLKKKGRRKIKEMKKSILQTLREQYNNGSFFYVFVWLGWLFIGTVFYTYVDFEGSFCKGFYFSVNVGYSIGFGVLHERSDASKAFSILYLLVGAIFVSRWLAYLIELHIYDNGNVHEQITVRHNLRKSSTLSGLRRDLYVWIVMNYSGLFIIYLWLIYVFFGTTWSCAVIGWSFIDGIYFAISAMSTGGLMGIPEDSPDYAFLVVGLFACTGVPLVNVADYFSCF